MTMGLSEPKQNMRVKGIHKKKSIPFPIMFLTKPNHTKSQWYHLLHPCRPSYMQVFENISLNTHTHKCYMWLKSDRRLYSRVLSIFKLCHAVAVINSNFIWKFSSSICSNKSGNICSESLTTEKHLDISAMYSI